MTLTLNQQETLHAIVTRTGMLLNPVPKLVEKGLVVAETVPNTTIRGKYTGVYHPPTLTQYRLTPLGFEVYEKLRTKWFEKKRKDLSDEFDRDLQRARTKVAT